MFATQRNLSNFYTFRRDAGILGILNHRNQRLQLLRSEVFQFLHDVRLVIQFRSLLRISLIRCKSSRKYRFLFANNSWSSPIICLFLFMAKGFYVLALAKLEIVSSKVDFHQSGIEKGTRERVRSKVTKFGYHYKFLSSF